MRCAPSCVSGLQNTRSACFSICPNYWSKSPRISRSWKKGNVSEGPSLFDVIQSRYGNREAAIDKIRARLRLHNKSDAALARRAGMHPAQLSRYMCKEVTPDLDTLLVIDEACEKLIKDE